MQYSTKLYKNLIYLLENAQHLSALNLCRGKIVINDEPHEVPPFETLMMMSKVFQEAVEDCFSLLNSSLGASQTVENLVINKQSRVILKYKRLEFLKKLACSSIAEEVFATQKELDYFKQVIKRIQYSKKRVPEYKKKRISKAEQRRLMKMVVLENEARQGGYQFIAGVDEAGRGPLAGPVVAAACIIPSNVFFPGVNDSKQLSSEERADLFEIISKDDRVQFGIGIIYHEEIDRINIYQAAKLAMAEAVKNLTPKPDFLLVDGLELDYSEIPCRKIIGGDALSQCIAAASILAKVTRDKMMMNYHTLWPEYGFDQHKGYYTTQHVQAIEKYGYCPIHRMTFDPIKSFFL